jgi:hypothetical protein
MNTGSRTIIMVSSLFSQIALIDCPAGVMQMLPLLPFVVTSLPLAETFCVVSAPAIATLTSWNVFVCSSRRPGMTCAL